MPLTSFDEPGWKVAALGQLVEAMDGFFDLGVKRTLWFWFDHRRSFQTQDAGVVIAQAAHRRGVPSSRSARSAGATSIPLSDSARQMTCLRVAPSARARFDGRAQ
jgi:hypothetical protein